MKPIFTQLFLILSLTALSQAGNAQVYPITTNTNTSIMGANGFSTCNGCTFNITPGIILTINTGGTCTGCIFNGGTVNITNGAVTFNGSNAFNNDTVIFNAAPSVQNMNFNGDSVAVNTAVTFSQAGTTITNSRMSVNAALSLNTATFTNDSLHLNKNLTISNVSTSFSDSHIDIATGTITSINTPTFTNSYISMLGTAELDGKNNLTLDGSSLYLGGTSAKVVDNGTTTIKNNSAVVMYGSTNVFTANNLQTVVTSSISMTVNDQFTATSLTMQGGSLTMSDNAIFTSGNAISLGSTSGTSVNMSANSHLTGSQIAIANNSNLTLSDNAYLSVTNAFSVSSSNMLLNGDAYIRSTGSNIQVSGTSSFVIGDGSGSSTAHIESHSAMSVTGSSTIRLSNNKNYYYADAGTVAGNTLNCNGTFPNACKTNYAYGCATINSTSTMACTVLAVAAIDLTATDAGLGQVALSWTDEQSATASQYLVERSAGGNAWMTIATLSAGGYTAGEYRFTDAEAPAGTVDYRITRIDLDAQTLYSPISAVTVAGINTNSLIGIHPNPAIGGNVYITTPNTGELVVNVYTITGQLLLRTTFKGQTEYPVRLPAQTQSLGTVVVQTIGQGGTQTFMLLVR